jgi:pSer/pThr/pTyr-binding forkhead associated (FHA) protein
MWKLVIEDDEGKRTVVPLTREQYSIGRKEGNAIRLTERNVSREHARLFRKTNGARVETFAHSHADKASFVLEDLTSYNGVFVNGLRITHAQDLTHGDLVQIGDYRIILQDETIADVAGAMTGDAKQTVPQTALARASQLLDRPNRFVMLAGPSPGAEFPLDRERLTIGRAEDANISINHNSVSRLHCEVHALGDGRFEIVDKGSSNGVRVNGADLRRGIVEPGDIIELGDVRFKFVGAGQIFRPTESQQLAVLNDRAAAELVRARRGATALPIAVFGVVVVAGAVGAWVYARPHAPTVAAATVEVISPEQEKLAEAIRMCAAGDCDGAHEKLAGIVEGSPVRSSADFRDTESRWAEQMLARADAEPDIPKKRALLQRVSQAVTVDAARRKAAADKLQQLDAVAVMATTTPSALPIASAKPDPSEIAMAPRVDGGRRSAPPSEIVSVWPTSWPSSPPPASTAPAASTSPKATAGNGSAEDKERLLALQNTSDAKNALKSQLEQKVYSGRASDMEINLLISTCKDLGDKACVAAARQVKAQRQQN